MSAGDRQAGPPAADLYGAGAPLCPVESPLAWSVNDADGWLQGPLDLAYLGGHPLSLTLCPGQAALLVDEVHVLAAFGAGTHDVATDGDGVRRLLFFAAGPGPELRWPAECPLRLADSRPPLLGSVGLDIADPVRFFETFLAGGGALDPAFVLVLAGRLVQDAIAGHGAGRAPTAGELGEALAPCGLACRGVALQSTAKPARAADAVEAFELVRS